MAAGPHQWGRAEAPLTLESEAIPQSVPNRYGGTSREPVNLEMQCSGTACENEEGETSFNNGY